MSTGVSQLEIRRLDLPDVESYRAIRLAALSGDPEAFGSSYEREAAWPLATFADRLTSSVVFGAFTGGEIIGMIGLKPERGAKDHHKGFLWGMYVEPRARRQGAAAALVEALLRSAVDIVEQITLSVVEGNDAAIALYRKFGFDIYGVEPRSLKSARGYSNEVLMVRFLKPL